MGLDVKSPQALRRNIKLLKLKFHPDKCQDQDATARFQELNNAVEHSDDPLFQQAVQLYARSDFPSDDAFVHAFVAQHLLKLETRFVWTQTMEEPTHSFSEFESLDFRKTFDFTFTSRSEMRRQFPQVVANRRKLSFERRVAQKQLQISLMNSIILSSPNAVAKFSARSILRCEIALSIPSPTVTKESKLQSSFWSKVFPQPMDIDSPTQTKRSRDNNDRENDRDASMERPGKKQRRGPYKTHEQKQADCPSCQQFPFGIGCRRHKSPLQTNNILLGKTFGTNADSSPCQNCKSHGHFCREHLDQCPGYNGPQKSTTYNFYDQRGQNNNGSGNTFNF
jgi:hypothetical protein